MNLHALVPLALALALAGGAPARAARPPCGSLRAAEAPDAVCEPYRPRAGDIVLYDNFSTFLHVGYRLAATAAPVHAALVIERPDGTPAMLELTGPHVITAKVCIVEIGPYLERFKGAIIVRRIREPLSEAQKRALHDFALLQTGKSFAACRVALIATPFNARYGLRRMLFARTCLDRHRWFCSELVVASLTVAGLLDPQVIPANATVPRDLAYDERFDLSALYHPAQPWQPALTAPPCR
ncbi:MAG: hypothetical protein K2W96_11675 [Gemmataceae bacterium]|nr:hypothetical protein [Gemmataceae bacterium]